MPRTPHEFAEPRGGELLHDVVDDLADLLGVYGACRRDKGCQVWEPCDCRIGFTVAMTERIRKAIANERVLTMQRALAKGEAQGR